MDLLRLLQNAKEIYGKSPLLDESALTTEVDDKLTIAFWTDRLNESQQFHQNEVVRAAEDYFGASQTVSIVSGTQEYALQGNELQVRLIERTDTDPDRVIYPININDRLLYEPRYSNWSVFRLPQYSYLWDNMLGIAPSPSAAATMQVLYIRRLADLMYGNAVSIADTNIVFPETPTFGRVSNEDDYYNGATVRILSAKTNPGQRAKITDYVGATRTATLAWPGSTPTLDGDDPAVYEIVCDIPEQYHEAVYLYAALSGGLADKEDMQGHQQKHSMLLDQMTDGLIPRSSQSVRSVNYLED